jgi:photosystem II stability/assembly factor-like uncharacterized protein
MRACLVTSTLLSVLTVSASPSWEIQTSGVEARLRGLSVVNEQVAWASGTGGTVVRTTDGGRHWSTVRVPDAENLDFRDIDAFDETTASVMSIGNGRDSRIYRTMDGGATWTLQFINEDPKIFLDAMAFWSPERGVAFSDSVDGHLVILTTTDGWKWTRIPTAGLPPALPEEGAYAASGTNVAVYGRQHVWIATSRSRVLRSTDGGRTWAVAATPIPTGSAGGIFSVAFRDERHGVVVGGDYQKPGEAIDNVAVTTDGGVTWTLAKGLTGYRSVVTHRPRTTTWYAAGPSGMDVSTDDGKTWTAFSDHGFHTFAFVPASRYGWGAGERGKIARLDP